MSASGDHPTIVPEPSGRSAAPRSSAARLLVVVALVVCAAVPLTVAYKLSHRGPAHRVAVDSSHRKATDTKLLHGLAETAVRSALDDTTGANSFDLSYSITETPPTRLAPPTTTKTRCPTLGGPDGGPNPDGHELGNHAGPGRGGICTYTSIEPHSTSVTGRGTVNISPKAMVASAHISGGLDVSVRLNDSQVWESGGADYGNTPSRSSGAATGSSLSGFADLTQSALGNRAGASAMIAMASPNGYLVLDKQAITGAAQVGSGTVDGTAVTNYEVSVDPSLLLGLDGLSTDERTAITEAIAVMHSEGYTDTRVTVSVDDAGFVRRTISVNSYADGGAVTFDATTSNFGCAGTVVMPGQSAPPSTSVQCVSPDATTTTSTSAPATLPKTVPSSTISPPGTISPTIPSPSTVPPATTAAPVTTQAPLPSPPATSVPG